MNTKVTYKDAGVDIEQGDLLVEKIKSKVKSTYGDRVVSGVGGFACLYDMGDRYLAAGTDGVGTKLKLAFELGIHNTVGIDLVAMCVNDVLCTGARPLFFMDYLATGKLDLAVNEQIIEGVVEGCLASECALIGGETAEMPGMYADGEYDLAGFSVGEVYKNKVLNGSQIESGMKLVAMKSNGFHSNGFSLIRKVCENWSADAKGSLMKPTKIYWKAVKNLLEKDLVVAMSHITGGGLLNVPRMNNHFDYKMKGSSQWWRETFYTDEMLQVEKEAHLDFENMAKTFNCGVGLIMVVNNADEVLSTLASVGEEGHIIGEVSAGNGAVLFDDIKLV